MIPVRPTCCNIHRSKGYPNIKNHTNGSYFASALPNIYSYSEPRAFRPVVKFTQRGTVGGTRPIIRTPNPRRLGQIPEKTYLDYGSSYRRSKEDGQIENRPPLTVCNLTHGQYTIYLDNLSQPIRTELSNDGSGYPHSTTLREKGDGFDIFSHVFKKYFRNLTTGRNARGSI